MSRFLDESWYRVAELKPRLAEQVEVQRHRYRGQVWYVLTDAASGRSHRVRPAVFQLLRRLNGEQTLAQVWQDSVLQLGKLAPGQQDVIQLLGQLHVQNLLKCDVAPDGAELFSRFTKESQALWLSNLRNPLSIRLPLWNPDAFLQTMSAYLAPVFSRTGLVVWLLMVVCGLILAAEHWQALTGNLSDRLLSTHNLLILWLTFPLVKVLHEFGHAFATKILGGEVHEMGVMILAGMLVPYVDASSSSGFSSKWRRALVGAAGMMVELALAAVAMLVWTWLEPGTLRSVLFNVMVIASISTLLFNANPLMLYDGYYILSDLLEIPNLSSRGRQYWLYLCNRYLFGLLYPEPFPATPGERRWFLAYVPAAFAYRVVIMFGIAMYLIENLFFIGALLAMWSFFTLLVLPVLKAVHYVLFSAALNVIRSRAILASAGLLLGSILVFGFLPMPLRTQFEGVVWLSPQAEVRAGTHCFVNRVLVSAGSPVENDAALIRCEDPELEAQISVYRARIKELQAKRLAELQEDRNLAEISREALLHAETELQRAEQRADELWIRSRTIGKFYPEQEADLPGKFLQKGELAGFVVDKSQDIVRFVVPQEDIDLVRSHTESIEVRLAERPDDVIPASLIRAAPAAGQELPSLALSTTGGGKQELDPHPSDQSRSLNRLFQFDLQLDKPMAGSDAVNQVLPYGTRAYVRCIHHKEPLFRQAWRRIRQLFLVRLAV